MKVRQAIIRLAGAAALGATLSGCSSVTGGNDEFSCSGQPEGVRCMSAREVYKQTERPGPVRIADVKAEREALIKRQAEESQCSGARQEQEGAPDQCASTLQGQSQRSVELPRTQDPLPIRTAPKVMRIWIAPWEDDNGDLIGNGLVYTEIEQRRWNIGIGKPPRKHRLHPLRVEQSSAPKD